MEIHVWDAVGVINLHRLMHSIANATEGVASISIAVYQSTEDSTEYYVHYESDVVKIMIDPTLFLVNVKFIPQVSANMKKVAEISLINMHPRNLMLLRKLQRKPRRQL